LRASKVPRKPLSSIKASKILFTSSRSFKKKRFQRGIQRKTKRRYGFKRWKFRFPKWKFRPRRYWNSSKSSGVSDWQFLDISSYRLYRRPHQPYRRRKPWAVKKHKGLRLIYQKTQPGHLLEPKDRLVLQQRYSQVYTKFYGNTKLHQIKERALHFRRLAKRRCSKNAAALSWYELRLDVSLCRLNLAPTIKIARLLISQGYVRVNGTQILTPEKRLTAWDVVQITLQSTYFFGKYWYCRNRYQRYLFKHRSNNFTNTFQHKAVLPYGFFTRPPRLTDLPRRDKITWEEFGRLLLV
jgi:ribosomal protein S4